MNTDQNILDKDKMTPVRFGFYNLLSASLYQPEEDLLEENFVDVLVELAKNFNLELNDEAEKLRELITGKSCDLKDLKVDYAKLFVGPSKLLAPPYESVYKDEGYTVMGDSTMKVKKFYEKAGMKLDDDCKEPQDHIAFEMNFMSFLCEGEDKLRKEGKTQRADELLAIQKNFFVNHPYTWVNELTKNIKEYAETDFYKIIACILEKFVEKENEYLNTVLD
ncbi:TorD/DmsD family molecular chaperone [Natranaerofaba carboxydovora]|uniref:TorD/DmsD family molecular chaperone n=1 Tax=Natranaerofaba carboxydovora TaxID=2742683 RepID=UPI001F14664F|nr:molecular chaperone TorD family protein [Natranaerofaba carboxydovora]UMZ73161.1 Tat proofreading chaperone DmsD [Natranaerofaba carboxydovora]